MKKILKILAVLLLLCIGSYLWIKNVLSPQYSGELELAILDEEVDVFYDENGVPHIEAQNNKDAYKALGYVHAQDRLWQMELLRRIAPGRLSEVLGQPTVETDKFFKALKLQEYHQKSMDFLQSHPESLEMAESYLDGINQFIENGPTPIEYSILGVEKETYTIMDILNVIGYMSFSFAEGQKTDPLVSSILSDLGPEYANTLDGKIDPNTTLIPNYKSNALDYAASVKEITENLPVPAFIGSNSWVLGPEKTKDGKVILANDPHIGYAQPGVWFQAHIKTPTYEMYGFHLGLMPFPLLGHNRDYAYGLTMFINDDMNFYRLESQNESQYRYKEQLLDFDTTTYEVKISDGTVEKFDIRSSIHGPVMNDLLGTITDNDPVSLDWVYTKRDNHLLEALYRIAHAKNMKGFKKGASMIHAPGLNVMYGDASDNIAWWASAKLYRIKNGASTLQIMDGSNGLDDQYEWLDFTENPMAENPSWNYVYSANNQPDSIGGDLYPGYYLAEDRAKRIVEWMSVETQYSAADMQTMIGDNKSAVATDLIAEFNLSDGDHNLWTQLMGWDGEFDREKMEPTLYTRFYYELFKASMLDELGAERFENFMNIHLQKRYAATLFMDENAIWWDNIKTKDKLETRADIANLAWAKALDHLNKQFGSDTDAWKWKNVHQLTHNHVMKDVPVLGSWLNVGPFPISGGNEVLNNQLYHVDDSGIYAVNAGPSSRRIIDFSDVANSQGMIPTGQSGNPFSPFYDNLAEYFIENKMVTLYMDKSQFESKASLLKLVPSKD